VPADDLWIQTLREQDIQILKTNNSTHQEKRLEDYIVNGLVDFDDISYDEHADLLYDLAGQIVQHFRSYLSDNTDIRKILQVHHRSISALIHTQMQPYFWETAAGYEAKVSRGFAALKKPCYTVNPELVYDFRQSPQVKSNMSKYLFGGFERCLYPYQQFQSDAERVLSIILDRETHKWFKPARGQFCIDYHWQGSQPEYQPDFIAETDDLIYMLEVKAIHQMAASDVQAKKTAAITWCTNASEYSQKHGGKVWNYVLISHEKIKENMTVQGLCTNL
jgi:type III restriction enzyme